MRMKVTRQLRVLAGASIAPVVLVPAAGHGATYSPEAHQWLANPDISERSGSTGAGWFSAWTANSVKRPDHYNAILYESDSGERWLLNDRGTEGDVGNFLGDQVVFSERKPGAPANLYWSSVWRFDHATFGPKVNTAAHEFDPTISGQWLLFTRYRAGSDKHVVKLYNRGTHELRTLATASGEGTVRAGQVRGDWVTWYTWGPEHSNVFRYQISTETTTKIPRPAGFARQHGSSVGADGTVYYQRRQGKRCGQSAELVMKPLGFPAEVLYVYPAGKDGERAVLDPPAEGPHLAFTVRTCARPPATATDVYWVEVPANPHP